MPLPPSEKRTTHWKKNRLKVGTYCEPIIEEPALLEQECTVIPERKAT